MTLVHARAGVGLLVALGLLAGPAVADADLNAAVAQEAPADDRDDRTFGPVPAAHSAIQAYGFEGLNATHAARLNATGFGGRFCLGAACTLVAGAILPAGALITGLELEACDDDATAQVTARLYRE